MIWQILKQEANPVSNEKFAYESEQNVVATGNLIVTQHHKNKQVKLISVYINVDMNEPVFKNSMFTDDKSYKISIRAWV